MAIHDVDKDSGDRSSPEPIRHDMLDVGAVMSRGTNSANYVTGASDPLAALALKSGDLRLVQTGTFTMNGNTTAGLPISTLKAHHLSFIPIPIAFVQYSGAYVMLPTFLGLGLSNNGAGPDVSFSSWLWLTADSVNIEANLFSGLTLDWGILTIRYYLFQQSTQ